MNVISIAMLGASTNGYYKVYRPPLAEKGAYDGRTTEW